ncbi:SCO4225 family membrane protein [Streptomyces sp. LE64]|uniref:SCO4225 family membrane protein n=1 Tax=Streptomyces sp. LE64 TaxID=3448653 RepID=UPI004041DC73
MNARTFVRLAVTNPVSAVYLAVFGGSVLFATGVTLFASDPGFVWVWPAFVTAPASLVAAGIGMTVWHEAPFWALLLGLGVCALVQSFALGLLGHAVGRLHRRNTARPQHG